MRDRLEKEKRKLRLLKVQIPVAKAIDKNEYESLFFEAVESVRK